MFALDFKMYADLNKFAYVLLSILLSNFFAVEGEEDSY